MGDPLHTAAESCFRACALEHLSTEERFAVFDSYRLTASAVPLDALSLLDGLLLPSEPSATFRPISGDDGIITDFVEEDRGGAEVGDPSSSMSLSRTPFTGATSIKGSSSNVPFFPGGFGEAFSCILQFSHKADDCPQDELQLLEETDKNALLCRPPGFSADVRFEETEAANMAEEENDVGKIFDVDIEPTDDTMVVTWILSTGMRHKIWRLLKVGEQWQCSGTKSKPGCSNKSLHFDGDPVAEKEKLKRWLEKFHLKRSCAKLVRGGRPLKRVVGRMTDSGVGEQLLEETDKNALLCRPPGFSADVRFEETEAAKVAEDEEEEQIGGVTMDNLASLSLHDMAELLRGGLALNVPFSLSPSKADEDSLAEEENDIGKIFDVDIEPTDDTMVVTWVLSTGMRHKVWRLLKVGEQWQCSGTKSKPGCSNKSLHFDGDPVAEKEKLKRWLEKFHLKRSCAKLVRGGRPPKRVVGRMTDRLALNVSLSPSEADEDSLAEEENDVGEENEHDKTLDSLPPLSEIPALQKAKVAPIVSTFAYAKEICTTTNIREYLDVKDSLAREYPFPLDPFQQAAVLCMENGESLFVAAHTSAGKTVVAEYAVALCRQHKTKAIYTSPIKALSNQKFRDFKLIFEDVGLVTGDIQLHPEAFCLIMTTEILRSMLYNGSEVIRDLEWVVFDEVHYINNAERGHVWEEVLIMLPAHVKIVMLSATVPNCVEFADWVGRIKNRRINVISTLKRPVPLEHFLYTGQDGKTKKDLFKIVDSLGEWQSQGYRLAQDAKAWLKKADLKGKQNNGGARQGPFRNDKNVYISLVDHLRANDKLPMVVFVFSRKRCDENAQLLLSMDLTTEVEKGQIKRFFGECIGRLKGSDKRLPQVIQMRELCLRGFAVHHSGILPILKEVVELLFQQGFVKILFATETFAMGVNMPARTVVFDSIMKHDGTQQRLLNTGEYIQMAGRAGRRGLDTTGTVIVLAKGLSVPEAGELQQVMMGKPGRLESQFRVTYSMLLNLLRVEQLRIEDMLQRSYVESASLRDGLKRKAKLDEATEKLASIPEVACPNCEPQFSKKPTLRVYQDVLVRFLNERSRLWPKMAAELKEVDKMLNSGRVLIVCNAIHNLEHKLAVLIKEHHTDGKRSLEVLIPCTEDEASPEYAKKTTDAWNSLSEEEKRWAEESLRLTGALKYGIEGAQPPITSKCVFRILNIPITNIVGICSKSIKLDAVAVVNEGKQRMMPRFRNNPVEPSTMKIIVELNALADNWANSVSQVKVPGVDFTISNVGMILDVTTLTSLRERLLVPDEYPCLRCFEFQQHMDLLRSRVRVEREVSGLKYQLSADALLLSEEYQNRLKVLTALDYVKEGDMVSFKGRVACEIHHQELLITELILENKLYSRTTAEVAAMLSATTCQYRANQEARFEPGTVFYDLKNDVESVRNRLEEVAQRMRVSIVDVGDDIRFDLMEVVYHWADGMPFSEIMTKTDAQEGLIVRCIQRLGEVCKDVRNAARIVGDPALHEKMEQVSAAIKRDIVFAASLYTSL